MSAVRVSEAGSAFITKGPPWAKRFGGLKLGRLANEPGRVPPALRSFLFTSGGVPRDCANRTQGMAGATRVIAMNACVSAALGRGR